MLPLLVTYHVNGNTISVTHVGGILFPPLLSSTLFQTLHTSTTHPLSQPSITGIRSSLVRCKHAELSRTERAQEKRRPRLSPWMEGSSLRSTLLPAVRTWRKAWRFGAATCNIRFSNIHTYNPQNEFCSNTKYIKFFLLKTGSKWTIDPHPAAWAWNALPKHCEPSWFSSPRDVTEFAQFTGCHWSRALRSTMVGPRDKVQEGREGYILFEIPVASYVSIFEFVVKWNFRKNICCGYNCSCDMRWCCS